MTKDRRRRLISVFQEFNFGTDVAKAAEMEAFLLSLGYERFAEHAMCLGTETRLSEPTEDGTVFADCVELQMTFGDYVVNGVGPTPDVNK